MFRVTSAVRGRTTAGEHERADAPAYLLLVQSIPFRVGRKARFSKPTHIIFTFIFLDLTDLGKSIKQLLTIARVKLRTVDIILISGSCRSRCLLGCIFVSLIQTPAVARLASKKRKA